MHNTRVESRNNHLLSCILSAFVLLLVFLAVAHPFFINTLFADDTDIFVGNGNTPTGVRPNVLFILDNSTSMNSPLSNSGLTRLQTMKNSFTEVINTVQGVNVGAMRFNAPGGSILFPVTNVDATVTAALVSNPSMLESADDAIQVKSTGVVTLDGQTLQFGNTGTGSTTVETVLLLQADNENAIERTSNGNSVNIDRFEMESGYLNGLRFSNSGIPVGATIVEARLEFTSEDDDSTNTDVLIQGQSDNDPVAFSGNKDDLASRSRTVASVVWNIVQDWATDVIYRSTDIASIVQEMVNHPDWDATDSLVFLLEQQSGWDRKGYLYDSSDASTQGSSGSATKLYIKYTVAASVPDQHIVGLRFQNVDVPKGATVTHAEIGFIASAAKSGTDTFQVTVENSADSAVFNTSSNNLSNVGVRPKHADIVTWTVADDWAVDEAIIGPNVTSLVQRVIDDSAGWCGNNAMTFFIDTSDATSSRSVYGFDASVANKPTLSVTYSYNPADPGVCINPIIQPGLAATEDDAVELQNGNVHNDLDRLHFQSQNKVGIRFRGLPIKQNATIQEAYLMLTSYPYGATGFDSGNNETSTGSVDLTIQVEDIGNSPGIPESRDELTDRTLAAGSVTWTPSEWNDFQQYQSPSLAAMLQTAVSHADWTSGNALTFVVSATGGGGRGAFSWDGGSGYAPRLYIKIANDGYDTSNNTARTFLNAAVNSLEARTWSPLVDTLYEAALYYRGEPMYYGTSRELFGQRQGNTERRYKRVSHADSYVGGTHVLPAGCLASDSDNPACETEVVTGTPVYNSPIQTDCQNSHIVILTDGHADNNHAPTKAGINGFVPGGGCESDAGNIDEECARSLVRWLYNTDQMPSLTASNHNIRTHTIAFNADQGLARKLMQELADEGGGQYKEVSTGAELVTALNDIFRYVISIDTTFTSPGATVNQFNRLNHRSEIFFSVFKPLSDPKWPGNIKQYRLLGDPPMIYDANSELAVDSDTGFFKKDVQSIWSSVDDGNQVTLGGAAEKIPANRNFYTYLPNAASPSKQLSNAVNRFHESNQDITEAMVGAMNSAERTQFLQWARGVDLNDWDQDLDTTEVRTQLGDPLHSIPSIVTYGGTEASPDMTLFVGTNEGALHAIDAATGVETFAFMPSSVFGNLKTLYENSAAFTHPYGLDGSPVTWVQDLDGDNQINNADKVYVYQGMRRGGRDYYALDVTDRAAPKLLWQIEGGVGSFAELGYTWSKPIKTKVKIGGVVEDVLLFAGGFDPNIDNNPLNRVASTMGNVIYMVSATTGQRLWMAGPNVGASQGLLMSDMLYAIPSDLGIVDMNSDGLADQFYVGDTGGQVWRFDIHHGQMASNLVTGGVIAALGGISGVDFRRFYFPPDISAFVSGGDPKLAVSLGSGPINEPLDTTSLNRFYVLFQEDVFGAPASYSVVTHLNLTDRTSVHTNVPITNSGWYIDLEGAGEKVLSSSVTINNAIIFTTYTPSSAVSACAGVSGEGRAYLVSLFNGNAVHDFNNSGDLDKVDRAVMLKSPSIPPTPNVLYPGESDKPAVLIGPEQPLQDVDFGINAEWQRTYWYEPN